MHAPLSRTYKDTHHSCIKIVIDFTVKSYLIIFIDHYSSCSTTKNNDKDKKQKTIADMFQKATKRKAENEKKAKRQKQSVDVESDIDMSDCEKFMTIFLFQQLLTVIEIEI